MSNEARELISGLEKQVAERTHQLQEANYKLQRRAIQLESIALVSQAITSILNLDDLLAEVVNLIQARFEFYHAGIFMIDESGRWAVLRQATGEAGQHMLANRHQLEVGGQSIVGWVTVNRQPRIALDVGADAEHFKNPHLPHTRSEMALPLIVGDRLLGALDVQSVEEAAFGEEDVAILSLMADQVAVAIDNALKFSQQSAILEATSPLYRASRRIALATSLDDMLQSIVDYSASTHMDRCAIYVYTESTPNGEAGWIEVAALWDRASDPPDPVGTRYPVQGSNLMGQLQQETAKPVVVNDLLAEAIDERVDAETHEILADKLQLRAVLILPLSTTGRPTGLLFMASRQPHSWSEAELRTFQSLTDHTAPAVANARLFDQIQTASQRERQINQIADKIRQSLDMEAILKTTLQELSEAIGATEAFAYLGTRASIAPPNGGQGNGHDESGPT